MTLWNWLLRRRKIDRDLDEEIRGHLTMAARDRVEDGADPEAARLSAIKDFGNILLTTEATRGVCGRRPNGSPISGKTPASACGR